MLLITGARLGDILGHRRMFLAGIGLFTLASLGCGLAPSAGTLVALRFLQGAGAAAMIPQVLSLIQRTYTAPGPRARAMTIYATIISGGAVLGQVLGGLLVSANLFGSSWRPVFLVNVPVGLAVLACARLLPAQGQRDRQRSLDLPGLAVLTPAVLALVLPLVLGQPLGWPAWGWALLGASVLLFGLLGLVEHRVAGRGGQPILPRALLGLPGMAAGLGGLAAVMAVFGGWLFGLALELQDGLGESPLRAGLTFIPCGVAFALVSLNWRRLPARYHEGLAMTGFVLTAVGLLWSGLLIRSGDAPGPWLYVALAVAGMAGWPAAFGVLMTRVLLRVPVELAADATGVVVTVNQLGIVVGIATFGTLYLNLAGGRPAAGAWARAIGGAHGPRRSRSPRPTRTSRCRSRWRGWRQSAWCSPWPTSGPRGFRSRWLRRRRLRPRRPRPRRLGGRALRHGSAAVGCRTMATTHRLELDDQTLREWDAVVVAAGPDGIVLDRSAFYPGGSGQPPDHGTLLWGGVQTRIVDARKDDGELLLVPLEGDPLPAVGASVRGAVEDDRRTALMRTHSGLHVLCGVVFRDFGALVTGGNMEPLTARMDFNLEAVPPGFKEAVEEACNAELRSDRKIVVRSLPRAEAFEIPDIIRTATNLVPDDVEEVRIVDIVGLDQQADGGTHVASTAAVGRMSVVKVENKGKGFRRLRIAIGD